MKDFPLRWFIIILVLLSMVYPAYALKSAMGIDILKGYHAADLVKMPMKAIAHKVTH